MPDLVEVSNAGRAGYICHDRRNVDRLNPRADEGLDRVARRSVQGKRPKSEYGSLFLCFQDLGYGRSPHLNTFTLKPIPPLIHWRVHISRLAAYRVKQNPSRRAKFRNTSQLAAGIGISRMLPLFQTEAVTYSTPEKRKRSSPRLGVYEAIGCPTLKGLSGNR